MAPPPYRCYASRNGTVKKQHRGQLWLDREPVMRHRDVGFIRASAHLVVIEQSQLTVGPHRYLV